MVCADTAHNLNRGGKTNMKNKILLVRVLREERRTFGWHSHNSGHGYDGHSSRRSNIKMRIMSIRTSVGNTSNIQERANGLFLLVIFDIWRRNRNESWKGIITKYWLPQHGFKISWCKVMLCVKKMRNALFNVWYPVQFSWILFYRLRAWCVSYSRES